MLIDHEIWCSFRYIFFYLFLFRILLNYFINLLNVKLSIMHKSKYINVVNGRNSGVGYAIGNRYCLDVSVCCIYFFWFESVPCVSLDDNYFIRMSSCQMVMVILNAEFHTFCFPFLIAHFFQRFQIHFAVVLLAVCFFIRRMIEIELQKWWNQWWKFINKYSRVGECERWSLEMWKIECKTHRMK